MKIAICGSLIFTHEFKDIAGSLKKLGHAVELPYGSNKILDGEFDFEDIKKEKEAGSFFNRVIEYDAIREYWNVIKNCDAILVANFAKNNIVNYIGGNSFLEMGFAHVLNKKIYILNGIPEMTYTDEIKQIQPIILNGDLSKI